MDFHIEFGWICHGPTDQNGIWFWKTKAGSGPGKTFGHFFGSKTQPTGFTAGFTELNPLSGITKVSFYFAGKGWKHK